MIHLVDLQEAVNLTAFVLLLLHLLRESFSLTLLDGVGALERPASPPVRFPHVVAGVTAPETCTKRKMVKEKEEETNLSVY